MEYRHIDDCWNAIEKAQSLNEIEKLFQEFPRWSGNWSVTDANAETFTVENLYWDEQTEDNVSDEREFPADELDEIQNLKYLLNKEKVCPLDKVEIYELQELLDKFGYPSYK